MKLPGPPRFKAVVLIVAAALSLSACGVLGCGGAAANRIAAGGCSAGMRF